MRWLLATAILILGFIHSEQSPMKARKANPEAFMNISEIIHYEHYPNEEYEVLTDDGYYLIVNRIPHGRENSDNTAPKPAVLLVPGILTNSATWVANMPNNSLGFILADAGFDVWMANNRGSRWCRKHQNLSLDQKEFWNFSFHEMAMNDLPAIINFILDKTGREQIYYVGYSQSATIAFIAFSAMPNLAQKVKIFFALGPVYLLNNNESPFGKMAYMPASLIKAVVGMKHFCIMPTNGSRNSVIKFCSKGFLDKICSKVLFMSGGIGENNVNMSRLDVYASHVPGCTSLKNLLHWSQVIRSKELKLFDYGPKNLDTYNQTTPPLYKIQEMKVPTVVWSGGKDIMASPKDTEFLLSVLGNVIYYKEIPHWMHYDFLFGLDARQQVYDELVTMIRQIDLIPMK
ncbi:lipase member M-like [Sphaerodactylus townsendi]|uniref:lipase member M-like n=1 Tax=Sphaerodactylus townsendi TaxID=933632 RepID=UPI002026D531|nr:lipase member M-like [Sphaerodactylus townsendi]XP_048361963.1 lipase member M-like [Sphaerodactylus townsendi]XP_048361964.1 lipase member M-like [Sphaerodactylus townsendi]